MNRLCIQALETSRVQDDRRTTDGEIPPLSDSGAENETNLFVAQPFVNDNFGSG